MAWHAFAPATFDVGRDELDLDDGTRIGLDRPECCVIDAFRLRYQDGPMTHTRRRAGGCVAAAHNPPGY